MKILFVNKDNPFGIGGGDYATHAYLAAFSELCHGNIDVYLRDGIKIDDSIKANFIVIPKRSLFSRLWSLFAGHLHRNVKAVRKHLAEGNSYDYCVFNNSRTSTGLIKRMKSLGIKVVTIHHNVEPEFVRDNIKNPIHRWLLTVLTRKAEKTAWLHSDYNLFLTEHDLLTFRQCYGESSSKSAVIGTFESSPIPDVKEKKANPQQLTFAITGSLYLEQGIDGIKYFFDELYPCLPSSCQIIISGRQPTEEIKALCGKYPNVTLKPNPQNMMEVIDKADIYLCPTRLGGGLKLRVMDGLRLGIPVIAHTISARGYESLMDSDCLSVFSNHEEFAAVLHNIISKIQDGSISRHLIRQQYSDVFSYAAGVRKLKAILTAL